MTEKTNMEKVAEFCSVFGQELPKTPLTDIMVTNPDTVKFRMSLIDEEYKELCQAVAENDFTEVVDALGDILYVVYGMGLRIGVNLDQVFDIIHKSNMSKLCETEQIALETVEHYKTLPGFENVNVGYRGTSNGQYTVYNIDTGKVLKSKYFHTPDFSNLFTV